MADISKITLPNNSEYDLKDATARSELSNKQATLVSGTNIKTINNESILGSGNLTITGGDSLPDQTGNAGKYLTTDGSDASWGDTAATGTLSIDSAPTQNSEHLVTSGGVYTALQSAGGGLPPQTGNSGKFLTTDGTDASWANVPGDSNKQDKITVSGILKGNGSGTVSEAIAGTDYQAPLTAGTDYQTPLVAGTDYATPASIPAASTTTPSMDGTASYGSGTTWARADHVHPTDTGRAAASHTHGDITSGGDITATAPTVASGDKIIINDESASKITNGPSFGASTTTYLRNDGTWATPASAVTSVNTKTGVVVLDNTDVGAAATSHAHGNIQSGGTLQTSDVSVGNGDKLVVTDSSDSNKVARTSVSFDGSTTNKYLSPKGTWENVPTVSYPVTSVNTKTGAVVLDNTDVGAAATSHSHGNITSGGDITATAPTVANGDQIVINDNSASKITNGPTFDGNTTNKYLSPKGTWENIPSVPSPADATPIMDGTAAVGTSMDYAREDHVHPTDTSLQTKITVSGVLKGDGSGGVSAATAGTDYQAPLPSQTNNSGKYLTTNGSALSWGTVDALPSQTGNSGKYLTTNGTAASWAATSAASTLTIDSTPTSGSSNVVSSGGIYNAINSKVNRTTAVNAADTNYTTLMARGVKLLDATTYDAVSDWSTHLVNGAIAWRYE